MRGIGGFLILITALGSVDGLYGVEGVWRMWPYIREAPILNPHPVPCPPPDSSGWCVRFRSSDGTFRVRFDPSHDQIHSVRLNAEEVALPESFYRDTSSHLGIFHGENCEVTVDASGIRVRLGQDVSRITPEGDVMGAVCEKGGWWGWLERDTVNRDPLLFRFTLHVWKNNREIRKDILLYATRITYAASLLGVYRPGVWWGNLFISENRWFFYRRSDGRLYAVDSPNKVRYLAGWRVSYQGDWDGDGDTDWVLWGRSPGSGTLEGLIAIRNLDRESQRDLDRLIAQRARITPWELRGRITQIETALHFASFFWPEWAHPLAELRGAALFWIRVEQAISTALNRLIYVLIGGFLALGTVFWIVWHYRNTAPPHGEALILLDSHLRDIIHRGRKLREHLCRKKGDSPASRHDVRQLPDIQEEIQRFHEDRNRLLAAMRSVTAHFVTSPWGWLRWFLYLWWTLRVEWLLARGLGQRMWMCRIFRTLDRLSQMRDVRLQESHITVGAILSEVVQSYAGQVSVSIEGDPQDLHTPLYASYAHRIMHLIHHALRNAVEAGARKIVIHVERDWDHEKLSIAVEDDGTGLSRELLTLDSRQRIRRVFTRGFSTRGRGRGQGFTESDLLWIHIVLGGNVHLFPADPSHPEKGTVFILELPVSRICLIPEHVTREEDHAYPGI